MRHNADDTFTYSRAELDARDKEFNGVIDDRKDLLEELKKLVESLQDSVNDVPDEYIASAQSLINRIEDK